MYTFDFHAKLRQLEKSVFIDVNTLSVFNNGEQALAVKQHKNKRAQSVSAAKLAQATTEDRRYLDSSVDGSFDEFLMAIPYPYVPEYDEFEANGRIKKRGWRSAALQLVRLNVATLDEVRRIFNSRSLGETPYDKMNAAGKHRMQKGA